MPVGELIDVLGRASIEAVLELSAAGMAGEKHQCCKGGHIMWQGTQEGKVFLSDRKRRRVGREVEIPAYEAMHTTALNLG